MLRYEYEYEPFSDILRLDEREHFLADCVSYMKTIREYNVSFMWLLSNGAWRISYRWGCWEKGVFV